MKAIEISNYNKNNLVEIIDRDIPSINDDEVLIKVKAASLNPLDILIMNGSLKLLYSYKMPLILGNECSGIIEKVGKKVKDFKIGDKVYSRLPVDKIGALAEYVAISQFAVAKMPENMSFKSAAAIPLTGLTAYQALKDILKVNKGEKLLITGGSGSFGQMAVPIAKELGLEVIITGNSKSKDTFLKLGASQYISYETENYVDIVHDVDYVIDTLGEKEFNNEIKTLKRGGKLLSLRGIPNKAFATRYGFKGLKKVLFSLAGSKFDKLLNKNGCSYDFIFVQSNKKELEEVTNIVIKNNIVPATDSHNWKLEEFNEALKYYLEGKAKGKIVFVLD